MEILGQGLILPSPGTLAGFYVPGAGVPAQELPCRFIDTRELPVFSDPRRRRRCNRAGLLALETLGPAVRGALGGADPSRVGIYTYGAGDEDIDTFPLFWRDGEGMDKALSRISFSNKLLHSPGLLDSLVSIELGLTGPGMNFISLLTPAREVIDLIESDLTDRHVDVALLTAVLSLENPSVAGHFREIPPGSVLAESAVSVVFGPGKGPVSTTGRAATGTSGVTFGPMWDIISLIREESECAPKNS